VDIQRWVTAGVAQLGNGLGTVNLWWECGKTCGKSKFWA